MKNYLKRLAKTALLGAVVSPLIDLSFNAVFKTNFNAVHSVLSGFAFWAFIFIVGSFVQKHFFPNTVTDSLKAMHKALAGLERVEKAAFRKTAEIDDKVTALLNSRDTHTVTGDHAKRVQANLRAIVA